MNVKKLAIIGVIALVVIGCVLAAGCTSTTTTQQTQTVSDDKLAGSWISNSNDGNAVVIMKKDGNGFAIKLAKDEDTISPRLLKYSKLTWKKNADGTVTLKQDDVASPLSLKYDSLKDAFTVSNGDTLTRMDPVTGIWFADGSDVNSSKAKLSAFIKNDGTGYELASYPDGTARVSELTWKKNADGTYAFIFSHYPSETRKWTMNAAKDTITSSFGNTYQKKYNDTYYYLSILGPWINDELRTVFNADGTGILVGKDGTSSNFTWTCPEFGKFKIVYTDGDNKGKESIWTYDREKDTFTTGNLVKSVVLLRPTTTDSGVTLYKFDSSETSAATENCPVVGQWFCSDFKDNDGNTLTAVQTIKADGTGYWMQIENSNQGIQIVKVNKSTFDKTNWSGSFDKVSSDGNTYKMVYNPAKDVIVQDGKNTYTRIEPIVGIWTGISSSQTGKGNANTIINADGTGISTISYDDGTCTVLKLNWKENADGTYALDFSNGIKRTYTVDSTGKTLKTDDGRTKTKQFLDTYFLTSITGPWYNKENNVGMIFNADGTGIGKNKNGVISFTWKVKDIGKFEVTYTGGTRIDGTSLKGSVSEWTYDRENNVFTSQSGYKFIRPTETIKDRITYK